MKMAHSFFFLPFLHVYLQVLVCKNNFLNDIENVKKSQTLETRQATTKILEKEIGFNKCS